MIVGERLRDLRQSQHLSQGDIEKRTGLLRCYLSRVENGHTIPSIDTLERLAQALQVPMYRLFYDGEGAPTPIPGARRETLWGEKGKHARYFDRLRKLLARMTPRHRSFVLVLAGKLGSRSSR